MDFEPMGEPMGVALDAPLAASDPWARHRGRPALGAEALRARIDAAFAGLTGGSRSLEALHRALDGSDAEDGAAAAGADDTARHWSDYGADELEACAAVLPQLSVASWRFHLPAFLHAALDKLSLPVWETGLPGAVLFNLTYAADDPVWSRKLLDRFQSLDAAQTAVIRAFLEFVADHPHQEPLRGLDADKALRRYWRLQEHALPALGNRPSAVTPRGRSPAAVPPSMRRQPSVAQA